MTMQLVWIALTGIVAAGVISLFTPLAIKAGRALQWKTQPSMMAAYFSLVREGFKQRVYDGPEQNPSDPDQQRRINEYFESLHPGRNLKGYQKTANRSRYNKAG